MSRFVAIPVLVLVLVALPAAARDLVVLSGRAMGTGWSVKFVAPSASIDRERMRGDIAARLETLEQQFSTFRPRSELSRFNVSADTAWTPVARELAEVGLAARAMSERTGGAFDPTVLPLVELWGFGARPRGATLPDAVAIANARARVDWRQLEARVEPPALRKRRADIAVDLSSIAKGFASDEIVRLLATRGIVECFVQIAGDVACRGHSAEGKPWRVGIEEPRDEGHAIACVVGLSDRALSTSGDNRNSYVVGGRRYSHLIDPRRGEPVASGALASVSVMAESCARSSALATALFVLGPDEGFRFATTERLACLFILREDEGFVPRATPEFVRRQGETELSSTVQP